MPTEKRKEYMRDYYSKWRKNNKDKIALIEQRRYNKNKYKKYGITKEIVDQLLQEQDNKCYICSVNFVEGIKINIDHCHTSKKVRGILCINCNLGIGHFKDNIELLENAIKYIIKSKL